MEEKKNANNGKQEKIAVQKKPLKPFIPQKLKQHKQKNTHTCVVAAYGFVGFSNLVHTLLCHQRQHTICRLCLEYKKKKNKTKQESCTQNTVNSIPISFSLSIKCKYMAHEIAPIHYFCIVRVHIYSFINILQTTIHYTR